MTVDTMQCITITAMLTALAFVWVDSLPRLGNDTGSPTLDEGSDSTAIKNGHYMKNRTRLLEELIKSEDETDEIDAIKAMKRKASKLPRVTAGEQNNKQSIENIFRNDSRGSGETPYFKEVPLNISRTTIGSYMIFKEMEDALRGLRETSSIKNSPTKSDMFSKGKSFYANFYVKKNIGGSTVNTTTSDSSLRERKILLSSKTHNSESDMDRTSNEDNFSADSFIATPDDDYDDEVMSDISLSAGVTGFPGDEAKSVERTFDQSNKEYSGDQIVSSADHSFSAESRQSVQHPEEEQHQSGDAREELEDVDVIYSDDIPNFG